ncbi:Pyrimidine-specific ribonucleoside hydrolase RihA [Pseudobythopirellula maris]|uniref:Pyrimidine-specific ribonucleoside hydrolase RihA n=1 Tax=Pseudobythopirellula maris TaxID=2527991 RepID=A0A5C5ZJD7_9BACT|nr:nucleoside hydrolase [Pseudobythopirellula maris]TWT87298.1 Pyrimidine-specific ribonucleoside hydrolase RihA [Pseudobythopirellula maris]
MTRKVILDIDPGVDDAVALCVALADPRLEVVAVTATGGNVDARQATLNTQAIIEQVDPLRWPRIGAADPQLVLRADARDLHGAKGLGGAEPPTVELANRHPAIKVIAEEVRQAPKEVTIVCTGPLSNLAAALRYEPEVVEQIGRVVTLGGSVAAGGNITPAAEFNVFCNAEAAKAVYGSSLAKTVVPLDVTQRFVVDYDLMELLKGLGTRTADFLSQILPPFYRVHRQQFGMEGVYMHDVAAVAMASHPEWFTTEPMYGDVETMGELTHGATVFDRRKAPGEVPNVEVALDVELEELRGYLYETLERAT